MATHPIEVRTKALLSANILRWYLPLYTALHRLGTSIPLEPTGCLGCKHSASSPVERKGKKPRGSSPVEPDYDDDIVRPSGQSSREMFIQWHVPSSIGRGALSNQAAPSPLLWGQGAQSSPNKSIVLLP